LELAHKDFPIALKHPDCLGAALVLRSGSD
jgi:hypothetical protein